MAVLDPARLNQLTAATFTGTGYRNQTPGFDPRSGEGARRFGGRFNPPRSFPVICICLTRPCTVAELTKQAERQGIAIADLLPRELWSLRMELDGVLDLSDGQSLRAAGLTAGDLTLPDHAFTHQIGEAAHERGYQAIRSPSATGAMRYLPSCRRTSAAPPLRWSCWLAGKLSRTCPDPAECQRGPSPYECISSA